MHNCQKQSQHKCSFLIQEFSDAQKPNLFKNWKKECGTSYFMQAKEGAASLFSFLFTHAEWPWRKRDAKIFAEISM